MAPVHLRTMIRRTIRYKQNLCAALSQRFRHTEFAPNIFTDWNPYANTTEIDWPRHWACLKYALLVKLAIVGQIDLEPFGNDLAAIQNRDRVVQTAFTAKRRADNDAWSAVGSVARQRTNSLFTRSKKRWFQNQIFRRIAGDEQFCKQNEIGLHPGRLSACRACLGQISGDIAHDGIKLRNGNTEHGKILMRG